MYIYQCFIMLVHNKMYEYSEIIQCKTVKIKKQKIALVFCFILYNVILRSGNFTCGDWGQREKRQEINHQLSLVVAQKKFLGKGM